MIPAFKTVFIGALLIVSAKSNLSYAACEAERQVLSAKQADTLLWAGREQLRQRVKSKYEACRASLVNFSCLGRPYDLVTPGYHNPCVGRTFVGGAVPGLNDGVCKDLCFGKNGPGIAMVNELKMSRAGSINGNSCFNNPTLVQVADTWASMAGELNTARGWSPSIDLTVDYQGALAPYIASQARFADADAALKSCLKAAQNAQLMAPGASQISGLTPVSTDSSKKKK